MTAATYAVGPAGKPNPILRFDTAVSEGAPKKWLTDFRAWDGTAQPEMARRIGGGHWRTTLGYHELLHACTAIAAICHHIAIWLVLLESTFGRQEPDLSTCSKESAAEAHLPG
jgi:predicted membrane channel-forming protein YqfA (hemolysin III family)